MWWVGYHEPENYLVKEDVKDIKLTNAISLINNNLKNNNNNNSLLNKYILAIWNFNTFATMNTCKNDLTSFINKIIQCDKILEIIILL